LASALEVIPRTLSQNCGGDVVRQLTELRALHSGEDSKDDSEEAKKKRTMWGINGNKNCIADMEEEGIWDPAAVKLQSFKTAIESACMLLRIDDIVSGI
jgi:T-complex protein 1 subunit gamma